MGCLNSYKADFAKLICIDFGKSEFLDINIFNCYKALYSACSTFFRYLDFIRPIRMIPCRFNHDGLLKNTEIFAPLPLWQNKSWLKISLRLELRCSCELKLSTTNLALFWCRYGFILILSISYRFILLSAGNNEPIQVWYPHICGWWWRTLGTSIMS